MNRTFAEAVSIELEGETTLLQASLEPVFPKVVRHPLTEQRMQHLMEQGQQLTPPATTFELLTTAFAEGVAVGALLGDLDRHTFD